MTAKEEAIDRTTETRKVLKTELTVIEAREKYDKTLDAYHEYDERQTVMYVTSRTWIPFVYKNDTLQVNNKTLYSKTVALE